MVVAAMGGKLHGFTSVGDLSLAISARLVKDKPQDLE